MNCKRGEKERNRAKKFEWEREENIHLNSGRFDRAMSVPRSLEELERLQPVHAQQVAVQLKKQRNGGVHLYTSDLGTTFKN